jgi:hypothetical protein
MRTYFATGLLLSAAQSISVVLKIDTNELEVDAGNGGYNYFEMGADWHTVEELCGVGQE